MGLASELNLVLLMEGDSTKSEFEWNASRAALFGLRVCSRYYMQHLSLAASSSICMSGMGNRSVLYAPHSHLAVFSS